MDAKQSLQKCITEAISQRDELNVRIANLEATVTALGDSRVCDALRQAFGGEASQNGAVAKRPAPRVGVGGSVGSWLRRRASAEPFGHRERRVPRAAGRGGDG